MTLFALRRASTKSILNCLLNKYFPTVGQPAVILSDNGTQFSSKLWANTLKQEGVEVRHTSVYYPQGNPTERVNREIGRLLRTLCHDQHTRWATVIHLVQHWLNRAIHSGTKFSPQFLHFGDEGENKFISNINYPTNLKTVPTPNEIVEIAHNNLLTKAQKRQDRHNRANKLVQFKVGDKVLVRAHPQSSSENREIHKFFLLFKGPGTVTAVRGPNSYDVTDDSTSRSLGVQNVYNLKPFISDVNQ